MIILDVLGVLFAALMFSALFYDPLARQWPKRGSDE